MAFMQRKVERVGPASVPIPHPSLLLEEKAIAAVERLSLSKSLAEFRRRSGERKSRSFSQATCAAEKIPLGLQTCAPSAKADGACAAADCSPFVKKEYFLTATTPQAIACGVASL